MAYSTKFLLKYVSTNSLAAISYLCVCISKNLGNEFQYFTNDLANVVDSYKLKRCEKIEDTDSSNNESTHRNTQSNQLERYRQRYVNLCRLVSAFDDVVSLYLLFTYLFSIPIIVILIYALWSFDKSDILSFILSMGSLLMFTAITVVVTAASASLNTSVSTF